VSGWVGVSAEGSAAGQSATPAMAVREISVGRREVYLSDIADLSDLPADLRGRAATFQVAVIRPSRTVVRLDEGRLFERVRASIPAAAPWFLKAPSGVISVRYIAPAQNEAANPLLCGQATHFLGAGSILTKADLVAVTCARASKDQPLRFDKMIGAVRAARDIPVGETVGPAPATALAAVIPGQPLFLKVHIGPVVVTRQVEAIQAAKAGQSVFVKANDGAVFSAPAVDLGR
jgi:hypothetical protein